jgi:hypothetical protein
MQAVLLRRFRSPNEPLLCADGGFATDPIVSAASCGADSLPAPSKVICFVSGRSRNERLGFQ